MGWEERIKLGLEGKNNIWVGTKERNRMNIFSSSFQVESNNSMSNIRSDYDGNI